MKLSEYLNEQKDIYAWQDMIDDEIHKVLIEYQNNPKGKQHWDVAPAPRIIKIWNDYAKMNLVRDDVGLNIVADIVEKNVCKIYANTLLSGHMSVSPERYIEDLGYENLNLDDFGDFIIDPKIGQWRISDYAIKSLMNKAFEIYKEDNDEKRLVLIDQLFNIAHQRSDLASWFIQGGTATLDRLKYGEALKNEIE